jgi:hypothetical protein
MHSLQSNFTQCSLLVGMSLYALSRPDRFLVMAAMAVPTRVDPGGEVGAEFSLVVCELVIGAIAHNGHVYSYWSRHVS